MGTRDSAAPDCKKGVEMGGDGNSGLSSVGEIFVRAVIFSSIFFTADEGTEGGVT